MIHPVNIDKPHRCPKCHTVAVPDWPRLRRWYRYRCCQCGANFAFHPRLRPLLRGPLVCDQHDGD